MMKLPACASGARVRAALVTCACLLAACSSSSDGAGEAQAQPATAAATPGVAHPAEWRWSSYRATAGLEPPLPCLALDAVWRSFSDDTVIARRLYSALVATPTSDADTLEGLVAAGSDCFMAAVAVELDRMHDEREFVRDERHAFRPALTDLVKPVRRGQDASLREAHERHGYTLREIGDVVGLSPSGVFRRIRRGAGGPVIPAVRPTSKIKI